MNAAISVTTYRRRHPIVLLRAREDGPARLEPETASDWARVHERIVALGAARGAHERELCRWLLAAERLGVHARAGYASLREYADRVVGLGGRDTEERLRVGRALAELPALDRALASRELCWSAVREITRVATRESEQAWLDWAKGRRVRQIEAAVAARHRGDGPGDRSDPSLVKHRLGFEVRAETMALFRDLQAAVRADLGGEVDDDALLNEIARRALGGPGDEGRAGYQVAVTKCVECGQTSIDAGGLGHPVDAPRAAASGSATPMGGPTARGSARRRSTSRRRCSARSRTSDSNPNVRESSSTWCCARARRRVPTPSCVRRCARRSARAAVTREAQQQRAPSACAAVPARPSR